MSDAELQQLARNPESLTETAWEVLEDELDRRGLDMDEEADEDTEEGTHDDPEHDRDEIEIRELVTIRQFRDLPEALLAKGSLESSGIECFLADENLVRLDWFISNFIGGIKLRVKAQDAANAHKILDEPILEGLYVQGVGLYEQPRCPKCRSLDVNFQELDRPIAYLSAFLRVPMPVQRPAWHCHACDAEWEDTKTPTPPGRDHRSSFANPLRITSRVSSARWSAGSSSLVNQRTSAASSAAARSPATRRQRKSTST